jgi:hypothetical protein
VIFSPHPVRNSEDDRYHRKGKEKQINNEKDFKGRIKIHCEKSDSKNIH